MINQNVIKSHFRNATVNGLFGMKSSQKIAARSQHMANMSRNRIPPAKC